MDCSSRELSWPGFIIRRQYSNELQIMHELASTQYQLFCHLFLSPENSTNRLCLRNRLKNLSSFGSVGFPQTH